MGLDMYLYAHKYVARKNYKEEISDTDYATNTEFTDIVSALKVESIVDSEWSGMLVDIPVGYWRKANQIHGWIVNNCANGIDECQRIYISRDKAEELVSNCKQVLADNNLAMDLLPPHGGFFFGTYDIDDWYLGDLEKTIEIFENIFKNDEKFESIIYQASW